MTNQTTIVKFDGYYLSYTDISGNLIKIPAISGKVDYQDPIFQNLVGKGMLPQGNYEVRQDNFQQISSLDENIGMIGIGAWRGSTDSWGTERVWLDPTSNIDTFGRDGFTIHGGVDAGSAGCIDLVGNAGTFFDFFKTLGQNVTLVVDYSNYNTSVKNPLLDNLINNDHPTISDIYQSQGLDLNSIQSFRSQAKQALEQQLGMTLTDEAFDKIFNQTLPSSNSFYTIQSGDTLSQIAQSLGTTTQKLIAANPWLESEGRISDDGKYILIKKGEKLSTNVSDISNSVKLQDVMVKNSNDTEIGTYTNFFLDKANQTLLTNTELNSQWQVNNDPNSSLANATIEFDFDSLAQSVFGAGNKNWNGSDIIDNTNLNLSIRTDLKSDFLSNNNISQTGNVISGGDYDITAPIANLNGDGLKNVAPYSIVSDGYRPGNSELSQYSNLNTELKADFSKLDSLINQINQQQNYQQNNQQQNPALPDVSKLNLQLQNPLANLTNNAINAKTFVNIDPVVLDLNGDGVKLTSYNDSEVTFDVDNDGLQERTGWVSEQDGILVDDVNRNGKIDNITETISEYYNTNDGSIADADGKYSTDGLAALKKLDSNHDGKFNSNDAKWGDLRVWVDANGDAVTDVGELKTLTEVGVREINLVGITQSNKERNAGNIIFSRTSYTTITGDIKDVAAVDFTTNPIGYEFNDVNLGKLATVYVRKKISVVIFAIAAFFYVQVAMANDCFDLSTPIDFGNKVTEKIKVTRICKSEVEQLMNLPIYGFNDDGTGINIGGKKYKVCNDGFDNSSGFSYDNSMESFYNSKCNFLELVKLGKVKTPKKTYLKKFTLSKLKQIPSELFIPYSFITEQQVENFKKSKESEKSLGDLLKEGKIKNYKSNELSISFEFEDAWYVVKEVARVDLNDDGIEDIFMTLNTGINNATHRSSANLILIKQSDSDVIHELKEPSSCENLSSHDLYECLQKSLSNKS